MEYLHNRRFTVMFVQVIEINSKYKQICDTSMSEIYCISVSAFTHLPMKFLPSENTGLNSWLWNNLLFYLHPQLGYPAGVFQGLWLDVLVVFGAFV